MLMFLVLKQILHRKQEKEDRVHAVRNRLVLSCDLAALIAATDKMNSDCRDAHTILMCCHVVDLAFTLNGHIRV